MSQVVAQDWKLPKNPSTAEYINKMWYIHSMEQYTTMTMNTLLQPSKSILYSQKRNSHQKIFYFIIRYTFLLDAFVSKISFRTQMYNFHKHDTHSWMTIQMWIATIFGKYILVEPDSCSYHSLHITYNVTYRSFIDIISVALRVGIAILL